MIKPTATECRVTLPPSRSIQNIYSTRLLTVDRDDVSQQTTVLWYDTVFWLPIDRKVYAKQLGSGLSRQKPHSSTKRTHYTNARHNTTKSVRAYTKKKYKQPTVPLTNTATLSLQKYDLSPKTWLRLLLSKRVQETGLWDTAGVQIQPKKTQHKNADDSGRNVARVCLVRYMLRGTPIPTLAVFVIVLGYVQTRVVFHIGTIIDFDPISA